MSVVDNKSVLFPQAREKRNYLCLHQTVSSSVCCRATMLLMTSHGSDTDFMNTWHDFFFRESLLRLLFKVLSYQNQHKAYEGKLC